MEVYYYKCEKCGFIYQVPSYWMGYAAEETTQQMHFSPADGSLCDEQTLTYSGEGDSEA